MNDYRKAYDLYKESCVEYGVDPINFHYFVLTLSQEQLVAYKERAQERGLYEPVNH